MSWCSASSKLMRKMTAQVDVYVAVDDASVPAADDIELWVDRAINAAQRPSGAEVSVRVVDAAEMRQLNGEFREQDKSTNVLSFPAGDIAGLPADAMPLGDIVVCAAVVRDEAEEQGKALADHWAHMIVHGTLHLLGFDHVDDDDAAEMEGLEAQILITYGIANPYVDH
jgi:probable rRNA maturation factor